MICWLIAVLTLAVSGFSFLRQKLKQRKRFQRLSPFCFPNRFPRGMGVPPMQAIWPVRHPSIPKNCTIALVISISSFIRRSGSTGVPVSLIASSVTRHRHKRTCRESAIDADFERCAGGWYDTGGI